VLCSDPLVTEQVLSGEISPLNNVRVQHYLSNDNDLVGCTVVSSDSLSTI